MKAPLSYRFIFDSKGALAFAKLTGSNHLLFQLMTINSRSAHHKKEQIITSEASFELFKKEILNRIDTVSESWLRAAIRPLNDKELEADYADVEPKRIWEYGLMVCTDVPHQAIIFTDATTIPEYIRYKTAESKENILIEDATTETALARFRDAEEICKMWRTS